ncbi:alpha/beta hydrolase [Lachnospiraceae bacterium 64-25]
MAISTRKTLTRKKDPEARNQNMMAMIRKVHGIIENPDLEKHRQSQDHVGALLGNSKDILIRSVDIQGMMGEWVSVNRAHMKKYIILYCHGGGYSTGSSLYARTLTTKLASSTSMDVLCFDYRLAPENPYPAAAQDAMKAWNYLMLLGYGARDVIIAGDSAGGNMALSLVLRLKEEGRLLPRGLVLMSPWTDLTSSGKTHQTRAEVDPVLDAAYLDRMIKGYVEGKDPVSAVEAKLPTAENSADEPEAINFREEIDLKDPMISPLFGDFTGFPPTYIQVGDNEILLSDSTMLHKKMVQENVSVKLDVFKGMWHVFQMSPLKTAYDAMDKNAEFIYDICR